MGHIEEKRRGTRPWAPDLAEAERALRSALVEQRRLQRRRLSLLGAGFGLALAATVRVTVALCAPARSPGPAWMLDWGLGAIAFGAAGWALFLSRRADMQLDRLREDVFTFRFLRDAHEYEASATGLLVEEPAQPTGRPRGVVDEDVRAPSPTFATIAAVTAVAAGLALVLALFDPGATVTDRARHWTFLEEATTPTGLGFTMPSEQAGAWVLGEHAGATGARALVNLAGTPGERPATAVINEPSPRDLRIRTRCMASAALPDQACGIVFRYLNEKTHYVARIDAVSGTIALGVVVNGSERVLQSAPAEIGASVWQELLVHARADHLTVDWNGRRVVDVHDPTLSLAGGVGLWAPANCVAYFDELEVRPFASRPHPDDLLPFLL